MKILLNLLFFSVFAISIVGQADSREMKLFDAVDNPKCEDLLVRLDAFALQMVNSPTASIGQIVLFPGSEPITNAQYEKYLKIYVIRRKLQDKVLVRTTNSRDRIRVEFWSGPIGTTKNYETSTLTRKLLTTRDPILFDSDLFEMFVNQGKMGFVSVSFSACCISNLDWNLLSEFLAANRNLLPYVVIRGPRSRHRAIKAYLSREMRGSGFDTSKIKYLFADKNLLNSNSFSEVALFVSPKTIRSAYMLRSDFEQKH